jgi:nucleotide-binding universal stress UspA family protein
MLPIRTILHPTDFSSRSVKALELACALARESGARLVLLHVVPAAAPVTGDGDAGELERAERFQSDLKSYRDEMGRKLARVPVPLPEVRVERLVKEGDVAAVIRKLVHETPYAHAHVPRAHPPQGGPDRRLAGQAEPAAQVALRPGRGPVPAVAAREDGFSEPQGRFQALAPAPGGAQGRRTLSVRAAVTIRCPR